MLLRSLLIATVLVLPVAAGAQAFKCTQGGTTLYTDQPCQGAETVVPERTPEEVQADRERAVEARARALDRRERALDREQTRIATEQSRALAAARAPAARPSESADCRAARQEAAFRANTFSATPEQIRTARANAALACGQPAPEEQIVIAPGWSRYRGNAWQRPLPRRPYRPGFDAGSGTVPDVNYQPPIPLR